MTSNRFNLLFDASILANGLTSSSGRSGIYFTAYNILKEFVKANKFNIFFYCKKDRIQFLKRCKKEIFPEFENIKIINDDECQYFEYSNFLDMTNEGNWEDAYNFQKNSYRWTSDKSYLIFKVPKNLESLSVEIMLYKYFKTVTKTSIYSSNGILLYEGRKKKIDINIPLSEIDEYGIVKILIVSDNAKRPLDVNSKSKDKRLLGIAVKSVRVILNSEAFKESYVKLLLNDRIVFCNEKLRIMRDENRYFNVFGLLLKIIVFDLKKHFLHLPNKFEDALRKIDIFFSPQETAPNTIKNKKNIRKYIVIHDIIPMLFPAYFNLYSIVWVKHLLKNVSLSDNYFANSECTRRDFLRLAKKCNPDNVYTTLLAASDSFIPCDRISTLNVLKKYNLPTDKKYLFSLSTIDPRKNQIRAVRTFIEFIKKNNIEDMIYVFGGASWTHFIDKFEDSILDLGEYKDKIIHIGYVDDADLAPLYSGAEWFVYTSQYEGFGLPPLEAMSCGCPVVTSNNSSLPEVVGDAGIMIDWDSDEQHIKAYEKYYYDKDYMEKMAQKGLERSKNFSWEKCAKQMIEVMTK